jgi:hypothetical protein
MIVQARGAIMHKTPEWIIIGLALIWLVTPWTLVALAWKKWARTRDKGNPLEDLIDDPAFLIGQILATVSCCALVPLFVPATYCWGRLRIAAVDHGLIISLVSGFIAAFILPFGIRRAKWLSFVSCLLNAGVVLTFIAIESA